MSIEKKAYLKNGDFLLIDISRKNPICPMHKKKSIAHGMFDEFGMCYWYCVECLAEAINNAKNLPLPPHAKARGIRGENL